jgi:hypothetical protein
MKWKMKFAIAAAVFLAFMVGLASASFASAALPEKHAEYMKNESYKHAFDQFTLGMDEVKGRLTPDLYEFFEEDVHEAMAASVKESIESGYSEADAWETGFYMGYGLADRELKWDWLRKNAEDAQGLYTQISDLYDGYMTLEKGDEDGVYAFEIHMTEIRNPDISVGFKGVGELSGGPRDARTSKMIVSDADNPEAAVITFDNDTAEVALHEVYEVPFELSFMRVRD